MKFEIHASFFLSTPHDRGKLEERIKKVCSFLPLEEMLDQKAILSQNSNRDGHTLDLTLRWLAEKNLGDCFKLVNQVADTLKGDREIDVRSHFLRLIVEISLVAEKPTKKK